MCWISFTPPEKQIAKKDIPIFKVLDGNLDALYFPFNYHLNVLYFTLLEEYHIASSFDSVSRIKYFINKGFHSYDIDKVIIFSNYDYYVITPKTGFPILASLDKKYDYVKVNGVIPKGAEYYVNANGEYVSNKILLTKIKDSF